MITKTKQFLIVAGLTGALLLPVTSTAATAPTTEGAMVESSTWHTDASLNLFMAGLSGDITIKGKTASLDQSFSDVISNLKMVAMGKVTVSNNVWSLALEFSYMDLGASTSTVSVDMKQWLLEPTVGYKCSEHLTFFAGARYNSIESTASFVGPQGQVKSGTLDWWDPIVGAELRYALSNDKFNLVGHFDIGGSDGLTWQIYPYLDWRFSQKGSAQFGYRWLATDYSSGSGNNLTRYDMLVEGPQISVTYRF